MSSSALHPLECHKFLFTHVFCFCNSENISHPLRADLMLAPIAVFTKTKAKSLISI